MSTSVYSPSAARHRASSSPDPHKKTEHEKRVARTQREKERKDLLINTFWKPEYDRWLLDAKHIEDVVDRINVDLARKQGLTSQKQPMNVECAVSDARERLKLIRKSTWTPRSDPPLRRVGY